MIDRSAVGCWTNRVMPSGREKTELHDLPHSTSSVTAANCQILWRADVVLCGNLHITFTPVGEISINDIIFALESLKAWMMCGWRCVCDVGSLEPPTRPQQPREKLLFPSCCHVLKLRERFSYPRLFQDVKPVSIILKRHSMEWHHRKEKIQSLPAC